MITQQTAESSCNNRSITTLVNMKQLSKIYPVFTISTLRWFRFNGSNNGFNDCVLKIGRKLLIDVNKFEIWLSSQEEGTLK